MQNKENINEYLENEYEQWRKETAVQSRLDLYVTNEHFKNIVSADTDAVDFIYSKLQEGPNFIVLALEQIFPNLVTVSGYCPIDQYCDFWVKVLTGIKSGNLDFNKPLTVTEEEK